MTLNTLLAFLRFVSMPMTQYAARESPVVCDSSLNQDIMKLTQWFTKTCLLVNLTNNQVMTLVKSEYLQNLSVGDPTMDIKPTPNLKHYIGQEPV